MPWCSLLGQTGSGTPWTSRNIYCQYEFSYSMKLFFFICPQLVFSKCQRLFSASGSSWFMNKSTSACPRALWVCRLPLCLLSHLCFSMNVSTFGWNCAVYSFKWGLWWLTLFLFSIQGDVLYYDGKPPSALQSVRNHIPSQLRDSYPPALVSGPGPLLSEQFHIAAQVPGTCSPASIRPRTPSPCPLNF